MWQLVISGPGYFDTAYDLPEGETSLGRGEDNDIVLSGDLVSRQHARIVAQNGSVAVRDLGSRNGSRINGRPLVGSSALRVGDVITVGENTLSVRQPGPEVDPSSDLGRSGVKRFGDGEDIGAAVLVSKKVRDSALLRALDNIGSVELSTPPLAGSGSPLDYESLVLLYKVAESLSRAKGLHAFLNETTDRIMERANATTAVVMLRHPSGVLAPAAVRHRGKLEQGEVPVSDAIIAEAMSKGAALAVNDVRGDRRYAQRESVLVYGVDQVLCIPIGDGDPFAGVLYLNKKAEDQGGSPEQLLEVCTAVAHLIGSGTEKFRVQEQGLGEERIRAALERHHRPDVLERQVAELSQPGAPLTHLERKTVTLLQADLAGLSFLVHNSAPKAVEDVLDEFYARSTGVVFSYEGTIDKFLGDGVLALFGAPYARGGEALRAVRAALAIRREWDRVMEARLPELRCPLKMALHTGEVLAGTLGGRVRLEYTALGDAVSATTWLCAGADPGQILLSGKTLSALGARFDVTPLGERALRGGKEKIAVFGLVDEDANDQFTSPGLPR